MDPDFLGGTVDNYQWFLVYRKGGSPPSVLSREELESGVFGSDFIAIYAIPSMPGHKGVDLNQLGTKRVSLKSPRKYTIVPGA